jgi:hypothetical protein
MYLPQRLFTNKVVFAFFCNKPLKCNNIVVYLIPLLKLFRLSTIVTELAKCIQVFYNSPKPNLSFYENYF